MSASRKVLSRMKTAPDQELHIARVKVNDQEYIELRHYVPSLKRYGRGIPLSRDAFTRVVTEDGPEILDRLWPKGSPGAGQEALKI